MEGKTGTEHKRDWMCYRLNALLSSPAAKPTVEYPAFITGTAPPAEIILFLQNGHIQLIKVGLPSVYSQH